jgi:hypothetical protein
MLESKPRVSDPEKASTYEGGRERDPHTGFLQIQIWKDLLRMHPRLLGRNLFEQQHVCDLVVGPGSRAAALQGGCVLREAVGDAASGSQFGGVEGDVLGEDRGEGGVVFGVEDVGEAVAGCQEVGGFGGDGSGCCEGGEGDEEEGEEGELHFCCWCCWFGVGSGLWMVDGCCCYVR